MAGQFQSVVALGLANSRMKDLYDLWTLPKSVDIDMDDLAAAIRGTFARRDTIVSAACSVGLSEEFSIDPAKMTQWRAYSDGTALRDGRLRMSLRISGLGLNRHAGRRHDCRLLRNQVARVGGGW